MASVFVLFDGSYEDRRIFGVYASRESAYAARHVGHDGVWDGPDASFMRCGWSLTHHRAKVAITSYTMDTVKVPVVDGRATLADGRVIQVAEGMTQVLVPVPPPMPLGPIADYTETCDVELEVHELHP